LRTGKYGDFWGCSHYPNCDYTMRASEGQLRGSREPTKFETMQMSREIPKRKPYVSFRKYRKRYQ